MDSSVVKYINITLILQNIFNPLLRNIKINKSPMGHIAHLRKLFKSINTYDYIKALIKNRNKNPLINFMRIIVSSFERT